jgi:hypothetical protein
LRNDIVAVLTVLLVVVGVGVGYFIGAKANQSIAVIPTTLGTKTLTGGKYQCINTGPTIGVVLRVIENNGSSNPTIPVRGARVSGQDIGYCNDAEQAITIKSTTTNSSGWVSLLYGGFGIYYLNVYYDPYLSYNLSVVTQPTAITYAIFNLSTGNLTTHFCYYVVGCSRFAG